MQKEQIKTLLINTVITVAVIGAIYFAYITFVPKTDTTGSTNAQGLVQSSQNTATIGTEIAGIVSVLKDLDRSVNDSTMIFSLPAFKSLVDYSISVQPEPVGRENPFVPTVWKANNLKISSPPPAAAVAPAPKVGSVTAASTTLPAHTTLLSSSSTPDLLGNFGTSAPQGN